jgi:epoxyqueuosine reductase QueG
VKLRDHVVAVLTNAGYEALAPSNSPYFEIQTSDRFGTASTWSERHAAYVGGLGTFGLCDGLITPAGKTMRCGSVIARISIPSTKRKYKDHHAYCLFFSQGTCGKCVKCCPAGAITGEGHNKVKCIEYVYTVTSPYVSAHFGFDSYGCGLCQTKVPCESRIPSKVD